MIKALLMAMTAAIATTSTFAATNNSDDSVNAWGPWSSLATAAGPQVNVDPFTLRFSAPENIIASEQFVSTVPTEAEDRSRFFGAMYDYNKKAKANNYRQMESFTYSLNPDDNGQGNFIMVDEKGNDVTLEDWAQIAVNKKGVHSLLYQTTIDCSEGIRCNKKQRKQGFKVIKSTRMGTLALYDKGDYQLGIAKLFTSEKGKKGPWTRSVFVQGTATSLDSLQALAGVTSATYNGSFAGNKKARVTLNVNFSDSSWGGTFNTKSNQKMGTLTVSGGTIDGTNLLADASSISTNVKKMNITDGSVNASFFGDNAQAIAGVVDVSGTFKNQEKRFTDVFDANLIQAKQPPQPR